MSETTQSDLRQTIGWMKEQSGSGSKARKQKRFVEIYEPNVGHIVTGERYDDAGVGPATAQSAVESVYPDVDINNHDTISEALTTVSGGDYESLEVLVSDLDSVARRSGASQREYLEFCLDKHTEPSLVTLALLDDESIGLGTSQMREAFFDGTRDERKHHEAFVETTTEFIQLAQDNALPTCPIVGKPFDPMLAVPESRGEPDHPVSQKKVDGYRILIHVKQEELGPKAYAFSRARNDVTGSLPELNEMDWPDSRSYILDAEVIAETGSYSDTSSRIGRDPENVNRNVEMHFEVFDCIIYQDEDISQSEFENRFNAATALVNSVNDERLNVVPVWYDVEKSKDNAVKEGHEGIIVKNNRSPYEFGKRSAYWQKQKMDSETVDVTVVGFEEASGEKSGTLGAVEIESADGVSLGRSGSGFSDAQRAAIWDNQEEWMGRTIEIEGRGIGTQGNIRMPIFKRDRHEDGEPDTWERIQEVMKEV